MLLLLRSLQAAESAPAQQLAGASHYLMAKRRESAARRPGLAAARDEHGGHAAATDGELERLLRAARWRRRWRTPRPSSTRSASPRSKGISCCMQELTAKRARPAFVVVGCRAQARWLAVRGTYDVSDAMIDAQAHGEPFAGAGRTRGWRRRRAGCLPSCARRCSNCTQTGTPSIWWDTRSAAASRRSSPCYGPTLPDVRCVGRDAGGGGGRSSSRRCVSA